MGARRKARELALQMLFQHDLGGNEPDMICSTFEDLQKSKPNTREFAVKIFRGTVEHLPELDDMIQRQADNWRLSRMAVVDRNIIRMSVYEFLHETDTPKLVTAASRSFTQKPRRRSSANIPSRWALHWRSANSRSAGCTCASSMTYAGRRFQTTSGTTSSISRSRPRMESRPRPPRKAMVSLCMLG